MFSCCILPYHVYGPQKTWSHNLFTHFKGWLTSHTPHLWPFARRSSKVVPQEVGKDKTHQSFLSLTIQEGMMRHPANTSQRWSWALTHPQWTEIVFPRLWTVHNTPLERLVAHLVPAFLLCDTTFIHSFLLTYTDVATTQEVLDEYFNSYTFILFCRVNGQRAPRVLEKGLGLHSQHVDGILSPGLFPAPRLSELEKGIGLPCVQHARLAGGASSSPSAFTVAAP
ncbi:uncharacterized protein [Equus przewalskii]|uniref:Uncharacterized protein isoform X2 n=1 Tax=Equus przewalskii TaxID=9798 RepID=A0ABM4JVL5_EQUPR